MAKLTAFKEYEKALKEAKELLKKKKEELEEKERWFKELETNPQLISLVEKYLKLKEEAEEISKELAKIQNKHKEKLREIRQLRDYIAHHYSPVIFELEPLKRVPVSRLVPYGKERIVSRGKKKKITGKGFEFEGTCIEALRIVQPDNPKLVKYLSATTEAEKRASAFDACKELRRLGYHVE